jgi:hypothetical protein
MASLGDVDWCLVMKCHGVHTLSSLFSEKGENRAEDIAQRSSYKSVCVCVCVCGCVCVCVCMRVGEF